MTIFQRSLLCITLIISSPFIFGCVDPSKNDILQVSSDFALGTPGVAFGYNPFEFVDSTPTPTAVQGFDAQLAAELSHRLGFSGASFNQVRFDNLLGNVVAGTPEATIGISAISITPNRITSFPTLAFIPYNDDSLALIIPDSVVKQLPGITDPTQALSILNAKGGSTINVSLGTVFTLVGSRQVNIIGRGTPPYPNLHSADVNPGVFNDVTEAVARLKSDTAINQPRTFLTDTPTALQLQAEGQLTGFTIVQDVTIDPSLAAFDSQSLGIAIPASCCQLFANISQALKDMEDEGVLAAMREKWGTGSFTPPSDPVVPAGCTLQTDIASNRISNFIFTKYCPQTVTITSPK